jgi:hypothetical protein
MIRPPSHIQTQAKSVDRKSGESIRPGRVRTFGWTRGTEQYHEKESRRYGGDKKSARPSLTKSANRREMMRKSEEGVKMRANPQSHPITTGEIASLSRAASS